MINRIITILLCLFMALTSNAVVKKKNILVVCPYSLSGDWAKKTLNPITELDKTKLNISYIVMRNSSFKSVEDMNEREQDIFTNYSDVKPDLIIIFGPGNFILAEDFNKKWNNVPMILTGEFNYVCDKEYVCDSISRRDAKRIPMNVFAKGKNLTFIYTPVYCNETVELMVEAIWGMRRVVFFGGEEYVSREIELTMENATKAMGKQFKAYHPDDSKFSDISKMVSTANKKHDAFIYCNWHNKDGGQDESLPSIGMRRMLEKSVPLFCTYYNEISDTTLTAGFVSYDHDEIIELLRDYVNNILNKGKAASSIPFAEVSRAIPIVNYEVLTRMGFDVNTIKEEVKFIRTPKTIWEKYQMVFIPAILVLLVLLISIAFYINRRSKMLKEQKRLQSEKDRAIESDRMKTAFVQNVSHEIRTPLNAVVGFSQLLALPDDIVTPDEKTQYVEYIQNNSEMLMMLVNDILSVGDIERGQFMIEMSDVRCNNVCQKAMRSAETRLPDGVKLYYTTEVDDDFMIHTDGKRVQQVLINYLTNACKHTDKGEIHVHCSTTENPGKVTFSVADTGSGVPEDMAEKIFERFTKLNAFKQGVGLGLNICRTVAGKLNGEVLLDTTYTNGARFVFILPMKVES